MNFDPCEHKIRQIVIKAAIQRRTDKGEPEEKNITVLFNEMAPLLNIVLVQMNSKIADYLPSPAEMKNESGQFVIPRKDCPKCSKEKSFRLDPLCLSCSDSEKGTYKSMWFCGEKERGTNNLILGSGCGHKERLIESLAQYCVEHDIEIPIGFKKDTGIQTSTDEGLK